MICLRPVDADPAAVAWPPADSPAQDDGL